MKGYELQEVRAKLVEAFKVISSDSVRTVFKFEAAAELPIAVASLTKTPEIMRAAERICPKCSADMVKRQAKNGPKAGEWFWACSTYPKCRQVVAIQEG